MNNEIWTTDTVKNELNKIRKFLTNQEIINPLISKLVNKTQLFSKGKICLLDKLYYDCDILLNECKYPFSTLKNDVKCAHLKKVIFILLFTLYVKNDQINSIDEMKIDKFIDSNNKMIDFLIEKNRKYGNSALNPVRFTSAADKIEQIFIRIDDKINRLLNRQNDDDEDILLDLTGYFILLLVCYLIEGEK